VHVVAVAAITAGCVPKPVGIDRASRAIGITVKARRDARHVMASRLAIRRFSKPWKTLARGAQRDARA